MAKTSLHTHTAVALAIGFLVTEAMVLEPLFCRS